MLITRLLIGGSHATITFGPYILVALILGIFAIRQWRRSPVGKKSTDLWLLRIPIIGRIYLYSNIYGTTNLMSTLLAIALISVGEMSTL